MIRAATQDDLETLFTMAEAMWRESPVYSKIGFIYKDIKDFLETALSMPNIFCVFVSEDEDGIAGMFGGMLGSYIFNNKEFYAQDFGFYVRPEKRGGRHFLNLEKAYRAWALDKKAWPIRLGESSAINSQLVDEILQRIGYNAAGSSYILSGDNPNIPTSGFIEEARSTQEVH